MAQKKLKHARAKRPTKAQMKSLDKNIARYERMGGIWEGQAKSMKAFKKRQISKMKRTDMVSRIDKTLARNKMTTAEWMKKNPIGKMAKRKAVKKGIGRAIAKKIPGVGVAALAHDVVKGIGKATCVKKGGKWVGGKCQGGKKSTRKITSPAARDLKSKR